MRTHMRRALMTAALSCALFGTAFADGQDTRTGQFNVLFNDFIVLLPNGTWPHAEEPFQAFSQNDLNLIHATPTEVFSVTASRAWKVRISATPFMRTPASPNLTIIGDNIDPAAIYQVESTLGDPGVTTYPWQFIAQSPGTVVAESASGGFTKHFTLQGRIVPNLSLNMSGEYASTVTIIASLD